MVALFKANPPPSKFSGYTLYITTHDGHGAGGHIAEPFIFFTVLAFVCAIIQLVLLIDLTRSRFGKDK